VNNWTDAQIDALRQLYRDPVHKNHLKEFAQLIGKNVSNVSRKAKQLGLDTQYGRITSYEDKTPEEKKRVDASLRTPEETKALQSQRAKERIVRDGHPRGNRDVRVCPKCGKFFDIEASEPQRYCSQICARQDRQIETTFSKGVAGRREDLNGKYFRSRYEANYARYLNWLIAQGQITKWEYEPERFSFPTIKHGTTSYLPDFRVTITNGEIEYHEVKGWDYAKGQTARRRFNKYYSHLKLILLDKSFFRALRKQGIDRMIEGWEYDRRAPATIINVQEGRRL
jgi:hypothetical protein